MPKTCRSILKVLGGAVLVIVPLALSWVLFLISLLSLLVGGLVRRYSNPFVWWGALVVVTGAAMWFGWWPTPTSTASCSTSPLPLYGYLQPPADYATGRDANVRSRGQVDIALEAFDDKRFELLQNAEYSEQGFKRVQDAYSVLNNLARIERGVDLGPLQDRIGKLEERLNELAGPGESRLDAIRRRKEKLQAYLAEKAAASKSLRESNIAEFEKRFAEGLKEVSLERVQGAISGLDNALEAAVNKTLSGDVDKRIKATSQLSAKLKESESCPFGKPAQRSPILFAGSRSVQKAEE